MTEHLYHTDHNSEDKIGLRLVVKGKVQGVYFRAFTQQKACELNILGWVKNNENGSVDILAFGSKRNLKSLLEYLYKGPSQALVSDILIKEVDYTDEYNDFVIIRENTS